MKIHYSSYRVACMLLVFFICSRIKEKEWRQAFTQFKTKKGARSSLEALLKRVSQGREFNLINPLVDIFNSVSLSYAVPCGGRRFSKDCW